MKYIEFSDLVLAQEYYMSQKPETHRYWHWGYNHLTNKYTLEYFPGIDASDKIISIEEIGDFEDEYVYDIETEDGSFQCGGGCMILKNTDSVFTKFYLPESDNQLTKIEKLNKVAKLSEECSLTITKTFEPPVELEFEKIMYPLLLFSKKRYAYLCWEMGKEGIEEKGITIMGIQIIKREYCLFVKTLGEAILDKILKQKDIDQAELVAQNMIKDLLFGNIPIDKLIMSKKLKSSYKEINKKGNVLRKPAHYVLSQKMIQRDPMNAPKPGDRVSYVYIKPKKKSNILQEDRLEDPEYVEENNIEIDYVYYLKQQVINTMFDIFSCIVKDNQGNLFRLDKNNKVSKECKYKISLIWDNILKRKENNTITNYFLNNN